MLIGISGLAGAGKDTLANRLVVGYGYTRIGFADRLKDGGDTLLGFKKGTWKSVIDKNQKVPGRPFTWRKFWQLLGTEVVRGIDPDFWVDCMRQNLIVSYKLVIPDVRFPNEYEFIKSAGGTIIHVLRPGLTQMGHESEKGLQVADNDLVIDNDAEIKDFLRNVDKLMQRYFGSN